jgi:hypothetical protein
MVNALAGADVLEASFRRRRDCPHLNGGDGADVLIGGTGDNILIQNQVVRTGSAASRSGGGPFQRWNYAGAGDRTSSHFG